MKARNTAITQALQQQVSELGGLGWYHSIELPDGSVIPGLLPVEKLRWRLSQFEIPEDLRGKRVLDIGAWDGWFTFEMERRGASVVAIDANPGTRFLKAKALTGSKAEYRILDVIDLSPDTLGTFDIVLFFGVLYHLKHPLLALEKVCAMSTDLVLVESYVSDNDASDPIPRMEFYEHLELCGQFDNWVGPNVACLLAWCRTAGFATVKLQSVHDHRAHVTCRRKWPEADGVRSAAPYIVAIQNATSLDLAFSRAKDEYVSLWFESAEENLGLDDVFPKVGPYGSRPVAVAASGEGGWLVNFKLPLGLGQGWHQAAVRVRDSEWSNAVRIGLDALYTEELSGDLAIVGAADNNTWENLRVRTGPGSCVAVWVKGADSTGASREDFEIRLNGSTLPAIFVSAPDADGTIQINARVPAGVAPGLWKLQVRFRDVLSSVVEIELV